MKVEQLMTRNVATCQANDHLNRAAQIMWEHDCGAIPVIDDSEQLVGIVTDRDICMAGYTRGQLLSDIPVGEAMARQVFSVRPTDALEVAERMMTDKQIRRLPVVDNEQHPVGVLSLNDIMRHAASTHKKNGIEHAVVETLAAISAPRTPVKTVVSNRPSSSREPRHAPPM